MTTLDQLDRFYDILDIAPDDWPVQCTLAMPNDAARQRWPDYPQAALPASGRAGSGRGKNHACAARNGLFEAIEIASTCAWGDEQTITASQADLGDDCIGARQLFGFSERQIAKPDIWNQRLSGIDRIARLPPDTVPIRWIEGHHAATGKAVWLPGDAIRIAGNDDAGLLADSNGAAAGRTPGDAQFRALLELIERDAAARWWYGLRSRPAMDIGAQDQHSQAIRTWFLAHGRSCQICDITTDLGIPVAAAISITDRTGAVSIGFAAGPGLPQAAAAALSELAQMTILTDAAVATGQMRPAVRTWLDTVDAGTPPISRITRAEPLPTRQEAPAPDAKRGLERCLAACISNNCTVVLVNLTRQELGIPVWKAVSPDLCHWKPRFGRPRLLAADGRDAGCRPGTEANEKLLLV